MNKYLVLTLSLFTHFHNYTSEVTGMNVSPVGLNSPYITIMQARKTMAAQKRLGVDSRMAPDAIKVLFPDKKDLIIDKSIIKSFSMLSESLDFGSSQAITIPQQAPECVTQKSLQGVISFIKNNTQEIAQLSHKELIDVFLTADYLCVPEELLYQIAQFGVSHSSDKKAIPTEFEECIKSYEQQCGLEKYFNDEEACRSADLQGESAEKIFVRRYRSANGLDHEATLDLSARKDAIILSLRDIAYLKTKFSEDIRKAITKLDLSNNKIQTYDIIKIVSIFPNLKSLILVNNNIEIVDIKNIVEMPNNFRVDLRNNTIRAVKNCTYEKKPRGCRIFVDEAIESQILNNVEFKQLINALKIRTFLRAERLSWPLKRAGGTLFAIAMAVGVTAQEEIPFLARSAIVAAAIVANHALRCCSDYLKTTQNSPNHNNYLISSDSTCYKHGVI